MFGELIGGLWNKTKQAARLLSFYDFWGEISLWQGTKLFLATLLNLTSAVAKSFSSAALGRSLQMVALGESSAVYGAVTFTPSGMLFLSVSLGSIVFIEPYLKELILIKIAGEVSVDKTIRTVRKLNELHYEDYLTMMKKVNESTYEMPNAYDVLLSASMLNLQPQAFNIIVGTYLTFKLQGSVLGGFSLGYIAVGWLANELRLYSTDLEAAKEKNYEKVRDFRIHTFTSIKHAESTRIFDRAKFQTDTSRKLLQEYKKSTSALTTKQSWRVIQDLISILFAFGYIIKVTADGFQQVETKDISYMLAYFSMLHGDVNAISTSTNNATMSLESIDRADEIAAELTLKLNSPTLGVKVEDEKKTHSTSNAIAASQLGFFRLSNSATDSNNEDEPVKEIILDNLSFEIKQKDLIILSGPSGQGKSTLLRLLSKLLKPTSGDISIFGNDINSISQHDTANTINFVPQEIVLYEDKPILFNLLYAIAPDNTLGLIYNMTYKEIKAHGSIDSALNTLITQCEDELDKCGIKHLLTRENCDIAGGEKKRVAITMALLKDAPIMIFDEVTANLDTKTENEIVTLICSLDKTIIVVTHSPDAFPDSGTTKIKLTRNGTLKLTSEKNSKGKMVQTNEELIQDNDTSSHVYSNFNPSS